MNSNASGIPTMQAIEEADMQTLLGAVQTIKTVLDKYAVELTAGQRRSLPKLSPKSTDLTVKTVGYMEGNPQFLPPFVKLADYQAMVASFNALRSLVQPLNLVTKVLNDIVMLTGCDAYSMTLSCYHSVKQAAKAGEYNAEKIYADLSQYFPGRPTKIAAAAAKAVIESSKAATAA